MKNPKLKELQQNWLPYATISDIQEKFKNEELTSTELVLMYLNRIAVFNEQMKAVLEVNPDALQIAESLDTERKEKGSRGPLHGVPVLIKDNIATNDKMHTSAGSLALADSYANKDSFVAKQLREAGAIILGKTNMTEWANFMTQGMPSGYSSRGGQVKNPYGEFDCGGSSSGSGSAIAANFATVAIGTETSGSILSPASQNSLVGIKPTVGLISRTGIIPISHTQDTAGPMTKTVADAALLLNAITGIDEVDPITKTSAGWSNYDYTSVLNKDGLRGTKIGIAREFYFDYLSDDKKEVLNAAIKELEHQGALVIDVTIPSTKTKWTYDVLTHEFKVGINAYLKEYTDQTSIRSLKDVISYNFEHAGAMLKYGQSILLEAEKTSGNLTETDYLTSLEQDQYLSKEGGIDATLQEHDLDAIVFPNNFGAAIPAKAGYPSITVPAGYSAEGEPVGITFTSTPYSEATLIKLAYAYEQGTKMRKNPAMN
ncbi:MULTISPECIES: amidase family protein [Bacillaceae]|uniref:Amidase n=1 Tax=Evansella alkalicola TaxID=745819 RepID=A0ABS6JT47_9BACI|nr:MULTISPECIES: amidase family protein [Bacillaceae]MBU9721246.1 amidase [Bacillus alkalicola]